MTECEIADAAVHGNVVDRESDLLAELVKQNRGPIVAYRYCTACKTQMEPVARIPWNVGTGVRHVHVCKECGQTGMEYENGSFSLMAPSLIGRIKGWWPGL